jgi:Lauroyl/myristoyl acyltransferase
MAGSPLPGEATQDDGAPRPPPGTSFLKDLGWRVEAVAFWLLFRFLRLLGVEGASGFGGWLLRWLGPMTSTHRTVMRNLKLCFPELSLSERQQLAVAQWEQTGRTFAEMAVMDQLTPGHGRVEILGGERFRQVRDSGNPVVFVSGHLANFEIMASVILAEGIPCQVTYRPANNPYVEAQMRRYRAAYGVKLFAPKGGDGARELLAGLKRGESVALLNDQKFSEGPEVQFFGHPVNAAPGPTRLAQRFGTVLQPLSVVRLPNVRFQVTAHEPILLPDTGDRHADIHAGVQAITSFIEDRVRERPVDWFWVHKRFPASVYAQMDGGAEET